MKIIAIVESDDYSGVAIVDPDHISVIKFDDTYFAASRCMHSGMGITCEISEEEANTLIAKGVACVSTDYLTGYGS
jgi:hypothetical protein